MVFLQGDFLPSLPQKAVFEHERAQFFSEGAVCGFKGGKTYGRKIAAFAPGFERAPYLVPACITAIQFVFVADGALVGGRKIRAPQYFAFFKNGARFARKRRVCAGKMRQFFYVAVLNSSESSDVG